jgi:hypothetical protein
MNYTFEYYVILIWRDISFHITHACYICNTVLKHVDIIARIRLNLNLYEMALNTLEFKFVHNGAQCAEIKIFTK